MSDATGRQPEAEQDGGVAQPGDGRSLLEHSGFLDRIKHGAVTLGHKAADVMHKGIHQGEQFAHDPKTQQVAHEVAHEAMKAGTRVAHDHVKKVQGVADAVKRGDVDGVVRNGLPLVGEALSPHAAALKIAKDAAVDIAEQHASPQVRAEIEKRKAAADQNQNTHIKHIPHVIIDGITSSQPAGH
jgi:hypothetical protein